MNRGKWLLIWAVSLALLLFSYPSENGDRLPASRAGLCVRSSHGVRSLPPLVTTSATMRLGSHTKRLKATEFMV